MAGDIFKSALLLIAVSYLYGLDVPEEFMLEADSLFNQGEETPKTFVGVFKDDNDFTIYFAATTRMFDYNIESLKCYLTDVVGYQEYFSFIRRSEVVENYHNELDRKAYFSVAAAAFAKALFIGSLDSVVNTDNEDVHIYYNKVHDEEMNKKYYDMERGILKIEFHEFKMCFRLRKIDENKTNVMLTSVVSPKIWIPRWLFQITANSLFPRILTDFKDWVNKN